MNGALDQSERAEKDAGDLVQEVLLPLAPRWASLKYVACLLNKLRNRGAPFKSLES